MKAAMNILRKHWANTRQIDIGDWGKQYGLLSIAFAKYGNEQEFAKRPLAHLNRLYVKINQENDKGKADIKKRREAGEDVADLGVQSLDEQARAYFKRMVDGDPAALAQWSKFRSASIEKFKGPKSIVSISTMDAYKKHATDMYAGLDIEFDIYNGMATLSRPRLSMLRANI